MRGHHLKHWLNGGETTPGNTTLQCDYHHRLLHEGAFSIVKEEDETLRFVTADGRTIPRSGYRLEDFVATTSVAPTSATQTRHMTDSAPRECTATSNERKSAKRTPSIA